MLGPSREKMAIFSLKKKNFIFKIINNYIPNSLYELFNKISGDLFTFYILHVNPHKIDNYIGYHYF
jgi:hypothetical protein